MKNILEKFELFSASGFGLEIRNGEKLLFRSKERGIKGLVKFIEKNKKHHYNNLIIFDKIVGNGAALLCVFLKIKEVYGVTGSKLAEKTLKECGIKFFFQKTLPRILSKNNTDLCPIEKLSLRKSPCEFLKLITV